METCDICGANLHTGMCDCSPEEVLAWPGTPNQEEETKMKKYKMTVVEEVTRIYYVEAKSRDHAAQWDCDIIDVKDLDNQGGEIIEIEER